MRPRDSKVLSWLKEVMPLKRQARIAASVVPPRLRYPFALAISRWQGHMMKWLGRDGALTEVLMREYWIGELTFHGPFPIPWRLHGREALDRYSVPGPVLYYTTHTPLSTIPLRVLVELGFPIPVPIVDKGQIIDGDQYPVLGMAERVPAVTADGYSLTRMRTLFRSGRSVSCLLDRELGGGQYLNPLRLAARLAVPVLLAWAEMGPDNVIDVTFSPAPYPISKSEEEIAANTKALQQINERILQGISAKRARMF